VAPGFLWRMDAEWKAFHREVPWSRNDRPRTCAATSASRRSRLTRPANDRQLAQLLEHIDSEDVLIYGSDFPHRYAHGNEELLMAVSPEHAHRIAGTTRPSSTAWEALRTDPLSGEKHGPRALELSAPASVQSICEAPLPAFKASARRRTRSPPPRSASAQMI